MSRGPLRILLLRTSAVGAAFRDVAPPAVSAPLGILYLSSALERALGSRIEIEAESLSLAVRSSAEIEGWLRARTPDLVGISSSLLEEPLAVAVAQAARQLPNGATVVLGGPYASCAPERALAKTGADFAVCGEGERSFPALVEQILDGGDDAEIPGVARLDAEGGFRQGAPVAPILDLDAIAFPAWDRIDIGAYSRLYNFNDLPLLRPPHAPLLTSRGCPYRCSFCHNVFGKRFRARSPENVVAEMELLHDRHGVNELHIVDDIFNAQPARVQRICDLIIERGLDVALAFPNGLRGDLLDVDLLRSLQRAGCYSITFALESASPRILEKMHKRLHLERLAGAIRQASELGIITSCFVMFGYPTETPEELEATLRWVRDSDVDFPRHSIVSPFPGTELAEHAKAAGIDPSVTDGGYEGSAEDLKRRVRLGLLEIMQEPRRQRRLQAVWERLDVTQTAYLGESGERGPRRAERR